MYHRVNV